MSEHVLTILDQALRFSLWVFIGAFVLSLIFIVVRLRSRRKRLIDVYREEYEKKHGIAPDDQQTARDWPRYVPSTNRLQMIFHGLILSVLLGVAAFVVLSLTPFTFFDNFATGGGWTVEPLRLTALVYERSHDGFSLQGEVWNQLEEEVSGLQAVVTVLGREQEALEEVTLPVEPRTLPPGSPGKFSLTYAKHSPFLSGYQVNFVREDGTTVPFDKGFDVR
jgi:hypothetical protein